MVSGWFFVVKMWFFAPRFLTTKKIHFFGNYFLPSVEKTVPFRELNVSLK
jgi:hypothetical protein